jgi:AcrR family transcriptional regulator
MADGSRPGGRTAQVRARILAATVELIARDGVTGFRYEEVAERAGTHKTSVYRNWPDRDELVVEALARYAEHEVPFTNTGNLRDDLVEFLLTLAAGLDAPEGRALTSAMRNHESDVVAKTARDVLDRRLELVRHRLEQATEAGELPSVDPLFFAHLVGGPVHLYLARGDGSFGRAEAERITDVVIAGIKATA